MEQQGQYLYQEIIHTEGRAILPEWDPRSHMVTRVMDRLIKANGLEHVEWEVNVIQSDRRSRMHHSEVTPVLIHTSRNQRLCSPWREGFCLQRSPESCQDR